MAINVGYKFPRGTRANLDAKVSGSTIIPYQGYIITDEGGRCAVGLTSTTYVTYPTVAELNLKSPIANPDFTGQVDIAQGNVTNNYALRLRDLGAGESGISFETHATWTATVGSNSSTSAFNVHATNTSMDFFANNNAYTPTIAYAFNFHHSSDSDRHVMGLKHDTVTDVGDFLQCRNYVDAVKFNIDKDGNIFGNSLTVVDDAYASGWNGSLATPTKNAVYDRIELDRIRTINIPLNGGGSAIATGLKGFAHVPFACDILEWTLLSDVSCTAVVDVWMDSYANHPPVVGDVITASAKPTITAALKNQSSTLTGWTTAIPANSVLGINVNSNNNATMLTLALKIRVA